MVTIAWKRPALASRAMARCTAVGSRGAANRPCMSSPSCASPTDRTNASATAKNGSEASIGSSAAAAIALTSSHVGG
ncbi:MAG: hypothetical protein IT372_04565 [Polyangiaceae bacterium]|nr:hypothetical protein [Polyangiaceae bacterium]